MRRVRGALLLALLLPGTAATAQPARDPDWPCQQIKVPSLSAGALWSGPPLEPFLRTWAQDGQVAPLVSRLVQRRVPLEQAEADIAAFALAAGAAKPQRLTMLMAGLFDTLDQERASVLAGLDRYGRRQRSFADQIRADNAALRAQQDSASPDPTRLTQSAQLLALELRVFEDRRQSLSYACNVPTTIEQRLFALSRAIQALL